MRKISRKAIIGSRTGGRDCIYEGTMPGIGGRDAACSNRRIQDLFKGMKELLEDEKIRDIRSKDDKDARFGHKTPTSTFYGYKTTWQ